MNERLRKYTASRAKSISRTFPSFDEDELINDAWIAWKEAGGKDNKRPIKRFFNKIWMQAIRNSKRFVSMDIIENNPEYCDMDSEFAIFIIEASKDLEMELNEIKNPTSEWKVRRAKEIAKSYLKGDGE